MVDDKVQKVQKYLNAMCRGHPWARLEEKGNFSTAVMRGIMRAFKMM